MIVKFLTIIAWIFAVLASGLLALRIVGFCCYSEWDRLRDNLKGVEASFPVTWPGIVAIVCWAWIGTTW